MGTGGIESNKAIIGQVNKHTRILTTTMRNGKRLGAVQRYIRSLSYNSTTTLCGRVRCLWVRRCARRRATSGGIASRQQAASKQGDNSDCSYSPTRGKQHQGTTARDECLSAPDSPRRRRWSDWSRSLLGPYSWRWSDNKGCARCIIGCYYLRVRISKF